jgi:hypothetical protein
MKYNGNLNKEQDIIASKYLWYSNILMEKSFPLMLGSLKDFVDI